MDAENNLSSIDYKSKQIHTRSVLQNKALSPYISNTNKQFIIDGETIILEAGQSIKIDKNTRVQYSNPFVEPCEYLAICLPAFSMDAVNRED